VLDQYENQYSTWRQIGDLIEQYGKITQEHQKQDQRAQSDEDAGQDGDTVEEGYLLQ
jgi:hypothetical protein